LFLNVSQTPIVHNCARKVNVTLEEAIQAQKGVWYRSTLSLSSTPDGTSILYNGYLVYSGIKVAGELTTHPYLVPT